MASAVRHIRERDPRAQYVTTVTLETHLVDGMILVTGFDRNRLRRLRRDAPTAPVVVSVEEDGIFEFQIWLLH